MFKFITCKKKERSIV